MPFICKVPPTALTHTFQEPGPRSRPTLGAFMLAMLCIGCAAQAQPVAQPHAPAPEPVVEEATVEIDEPIPDTVVYAKFQSTAEGIKPGGKFLLAVYLDIVGDYRISWTNPGDIGRETKVHFTVPPGFTVGPVQFPAPKRFERSDGAISYGYEGETAVFAEVQAPLRLSSSKAYRFDVNADWVACKRECATEMISAWFEMTSQRNAPNPRLSNELRPHFDALPRTFGQPESPTLQWRSARSVVVKHDEGTKWIDFIPGALDQPRLLRSRQSAAGIELEFERNPGKPIVGLLVAEEEGQTAFYDVTVASP